MGQFGLKFCVNSGDHNYLILLIGREKLKVWFLLFDFDFRAGFCRKMGVAATRATNGVSKPNQVLSHNHVFEIIMGDPPLLSL